MWRKIATIAAGPLVNVLVAIVALRRCTGSDIPNGGAPVPRLAQVEVAIAGGECGNAPGDTVVAINGQRATDPAVFRKILTATPARRSR